MSCERRVASAIAAERIEPIPETTDAERVVADVVAIGAGMFGAYCAEKLYRSGASSALRILVLEAGGFLLQSHIQNLPQHHGIPPASDGRSNPIQHVFKELRDLVALDRFGFSLTS